MNKVILTGRLTKDPEVKSVSSGKTVAKFTLACDRRFKNKQTGKKEADFIPCVFWGQQAEFIAEYAHKGSQCGVIGRMEPRSYDGNDGVKRYITEVIGDEFELIGGGGAASGGQQQSQKPAGKPTEPMDDDTDFMLMADDDDIPF